MALIPIILHDLLLKDFELFEENSLQILDDLNISVSFGVLVEVFSMDYMKSDVKLFGI